MISLFPKSLSGGESGCPGNYQHCVDHMWRSFATMVVLTVCVWLSGCTINIYQNGASEDLFYSEKKTDPAAEAEETIYQSIVPDATNLKRTGTVTAAEIMQMGTTPKGPLVSSGDSVTLEVVLSVEAYVSCFYQQGNGHIVKLFPNRIIPLYRLSSGQVLRIPGANGFRVLTNENSSTDRYLCLASNEDVMPNLPLVFQSNAFQQVPVNTFDELFDVYNKITSDNLVARVLEVHVR